MTLLRGRIAVLIAILMALLIVRTAWGQTVQAPEEAKSRTSMYDLRNAGSPEGGTIQAPGEARPFLDKWEGKPLAFPPVPMDLNGDGRADIIAFFIDDPATKIVGDAIGFTSLEYRLWAFMESCGYDCGKIVWMDPTAPEAWRKWLEGSLKGEKVDKPKDLKI